MCGTLGTAAACIGSVCDPTTAKKILGELESWYKETSSPVYQPENMDLPQTVANSLLCSDSVGTFLKESGFAAGSPEHLARCAGLTADVTRKMVELLNAEPVLIKEEEEA